jgi:Na+/proline symporter
MFVTFTLAALLFALNSKSTMYEMVQNAYKVTLVSCIVPLAAGIFWKRSSNVGAVLSVVFGLVSWTIAEWTTTDDTVIPAQLVGLGFSIVGMVLGSLVPRASSAPAAHTHGKH